MEKSEFIRQFMKNRKMIGSMRPSSRFLTRKMLKTIPFQNDLVIVELGPGTGVFTREILKNMSPGSKLLVFELNKDFYENLKGSLKDERVTFIHDSAENIGMYLKEMNIAKADIIVSSLPLANFSKTLRDTLVRTCKACLKANSKFIQFQYSPQSMGYLNKEFREVRLDFTLLNFPPAFVYICQK